MYASILIDIKHKDVNRFFDYTIPTSLETDIKVGMRVVVPFGNQKRMGYVIKLLNDSQQATKEIIEILDVIPTIQAETFLLIDHILKQTNDLYSAVFETVVPAEIGLDYYVDIRLLKPALVDHEFLALFDKNGFLRVPKNQHTYDYLIRKYVSLHAISVTRSYKQKTSEKQIFMYHYQKDHTYHRIDKYPEIFDMTEKGYTKEELLAIGLTDGKIQTLVKHQVLRKEKEQIIREINHIYERKQKDITLTKLQQSVYNSFQKSKHTNQTFLLKGITGSGKTELYLKWIKDSLDAKQTVLIMVPEIALIAQMAERLESTFGDIAIYHSHLSKGERFDQYMKIKRREVNIILGTRSAVFLPLDNLGLIIIDEAHDASYKQTDYTSYDARDIATIRASYHHCPLVLGSATPSIEQMYEALAGRYKLLRLDERPFGVNEPNIQFVDMREELKAKNTSMFSSALKYAINDRLSKNEQIMILFNRKGYAPFVMCRQCGYVPTCPTCGIALTYYQQKNQLKCHYCGYEETFDKTCHECHNQTMKSVGVGIEQVKKEIHKVFPHASVLLMDQNQTRTKGAHEVIWHDFKNQKADILLGTQMIAKGLDFPNVTLVGVMMADMLLRTPSYLASEEAFILLTQVSGRSGRTQPGDVIIQGYDLDHYAIKDVKIGYDKFYEEALYERKISGFAPFNHVYQISALGKGYLKTYQKAFQLKKLIANQDGYQVLGPVPAYIKKKGDQFRFIITIKTKSKQMKHIFDTIEKVKDEDIRLRFYPIPDFI